MYKSLSIHIAVNRVSPVAYRGQSGLMSIAETNGRHFMRLAHFEGYQGKVALFGLQAIRHRALQEIAKAALLLKAGGQLLITFSGHGHPEGWCLYDGLLRPAALRHQLEKLGRNVRVIIIADCCHSGGLLNQLCCSPPREIILLAAAAEHQRALAGRWQSRFVTALMKLWDRCQFNGDYQQFNRTINQHVNSQEITLGFTPSAANTLLRSRPFEII